MGRDYKNNVYLTIAIPKNSNVYRALLADAAERNVRQLPSLAAVRLADFYELTELLKRQGFATAVQALPDISTNVEIPEEMDENLVGALQNADDADDAWPD
jgi:hypothetical protein